MNPSDNAWKALTFIPRFISGSIDLFILFLGTHYSILLFREYLKVELSGALLPKATFVLGFLSGTVLISIYVFIIYYLGEEDDLLEQEKFWESVYEPLTMAALIVASTRWLSYVVQSPSETLFLNEVISALYFLPFIAYVRIIRRQNNWDTSDMTGYEAQVELATGDTAKYLKYAEETIQKNITRATIKNLLTNPVKTIFTILTIVVLCLITYWAEVLIFSNYGELIFYFTILSGLSYVGAVAYYLRIKRKYKG
jgi:hypothetical protein